MPLPNLLSTTVGIFGLRGVPTNFKKRLSYRKFRNYIELLLGIM
jgi:hypothetical protein